VKVGLADATGADARPDAAGGEGSHGAAKPHGVIHRNILPVSISLNSQIKAFGPKSDYTAMPNPSPRELLKGPFQKSSTHSSGKPDNKQSITLAESGDAPARGE
jgi:hypothetical protein